MMLTNQLQFPQASLNKEIATSGTISNHGGQCFDSCQWFVLARFWEWRIENQSWRQESEMNACKLKFMSFLTAVSCVVFCVNKNKPLIPVRFVNLFDWLIYRFVCYSCRPFSKRLNWRKIAQRRQRWRSLKLNPCQTQLVLRSVIHFVMIRAA